MNSNRHEPPESTTEPVRVNVGPWRWAVNRSKLSPTVKHVLLALAVRMDADGSIPDRLKPKVEHIAADTGRKIGTIGNCKDEAVRAGYLVVISPGGRKRDTYLAAVPSEVVDNIASGSPRGTIEPLDVVPLQSASGSPRGSVVVPLEGPPPSSLQQASSSGVVVPLEEPQSVDDFEDLNRFHERRMLAEVDNRIAKGKTVINREGLARSIATDPLKLEESLRLWQHRHCGSCHGAGFNETYSPGAGMVRIPCTAELAELEEEP